MSFFFLNVIWMWKQRKIQKFSIHFNCIFPIIAIYSVNIGFIQLEEFILSTILIVGSAFLFFLCLKYILKNGKKAALIVSLSFIIFFSFGHVYNMLNQVSIDDTDLGSNRILLPIFTILFGIGSF